jgi:membrane associated rhomboid family serine protease
VIPLSDLNPTRRFPWATILLIVVCVAVYFVLQPVGHHGLFHFGLVETDVEELEFSLGRAAIPCEITHDRPLTDDEVRATYNEGKTAACGIGDPHSPAHVPGKNVYLALLYSMFLHGSIAHLAGNMLFLWVFGNNIEDSMGHTRFVAFYLLCGVVAAASQLLVDPGSRVPMVGASGAISGVMGAYILLYPRVRVHTLLTLGFFITTVTLPAYVILGYWFVLQLLLGTVGALAGAQGGVAFWAHVGGFVAGLVLIKLFANSEYLERRRGGMIILPRDV